MTPATAGRVRLTLVVLATVSPVAGYVKEQPDTTQDLELRLEEVNGEWRISNPPSGIIVSDLDFGSEFQPFDLYFFDPAFDVLVPEPVYVPIRFSGSTTTLLAEALLRGPSQWLAPAVRTAFPPDTALAVRGVQVESGRAIVELTEQAAEDTSDVQAERMETQLVWTLSQISGVRQVSVRADGEPLRAAGPTAATVESAMDYDPERVLRRSELYAVAPTGVVVLDGGDPAPVAGPLGSAAGATDLVVNPRADEAAVVDATGQTLRWGSFASETNLAPLAQGSQLSTFGWDRTGLVWARDRTGAGDIVLVSEPDGEPGREPSTVPVPDLDGAPVEDLAVSLDGTRVAVVSEGRVMLGLVLREPDRATSVRIEGLRPVPLEAGNAAAVAWSDSTEIAVLVEMEAESSQVYLIDLTDWTATTTGPVQPAAALAASPREDVAVGTVDGTVFRHRGGSWRLIAEAARPVYPG